MDTSPDLAARRTHLLAQLGAAAQQAKRAPSDITLVAVSKRQPDALLDAALAAGQRVFGENRVQEAMEHWSARRAQHPDLELRLIGPLQSNKALEAVELFDVIETLDRDRLAAALAKAMTATGRSPRILVQVNTGEEPQKAGIAPAELPAFLARMTQDHGLRVEGLMCIPPAVEPAGLHFALLAKLARQNGLTELSMGMSADFETAVALGATSVRIGTAFFGERD
ncbi:YggS family pyridoxal phosphate-dependent enzyme [uncultured Maricaulis sp.]|uniref:YggS family pyridoxal phosphate-dependent enzyme n=1 Tax=uncultured Maricaulis sp. TaxID=174710 RepID=UPI0030D744EE|tara:strand:- start:29689 stop:30363 length:675 start_codon:yes stop_codon:yes gene_type:complete